MSLKFITGSSGSGKSTYIYNRIITESMADMSRRFLVIVPEQFTLETQRRLVELHPAHSIVNIDILSFDRLSYRVFDELGESGLTLLDDTGKNLILRRVAEEVSDQLLVLKNRIKTPGYIDQVKSLLSEFEQYSIDSDSVSKLSEMKGLSPALKNKLSDIRLIYDRYMEYISRDHVSSEKRYERLAQLLPQSALLKDAVVVLDGYTGFTPIQNVVLRQIISLADICYVTVTIDGRENIYGGAEHELFAMSKKMIRSLRTMAESMEVEVDEPVVLRDTGGRRFISGGRLEFLEKNIFSNIRKSEPYKKYSGKSGDEIRIFSLGNPYEELCFVATMIRRMVADKTAEMRPVRYRDFAIVTGAYETYAPYIEEVFLKYDIPVFADEKTQVVFQPCLEFLLSALSVLNRDFRYDDVIGFLKTNLTDIPVEDVDLFDQYLYRTGIRGKGKYGVTFMYRPKEFIPEELTRVNEIRKDIMSHFAPVMEGYYARGTVAKKTAILREFLNGYGIEEKLLLRQKELEKEGDAKAAMEYGMVYGALMELFDKMDAVLSDIVVDGQEFCDLLSAGLDAISLGTIPQDYDRVIFGDMERTRLSGIKKLFLIGANDGVIPSGTASPNILSQSERMMIMEGGVELAPTLRERSFMQRFYLYELLTQGSEGLYITYADRGMDGASLRPSYIIDRIERLFSDMEIYRYDRGFRPEFWTSSDEEAKETFTLLLRQLLDIGEMPKDRAVLFGTLYNRLEGSMEKKLSDILSAAFYSHKDEVISRAVMKAINTELLHVSVSRIEKYAACAYAYFLNYGLGLVERRENEFELSDMGTLYHEALKNYSKLLSEDKKSWRDLKEEERETYLDRAVVMAYDAAAGMEVLDSQRKRHILDGMKNTLRRTVWAIHRQVQEGEFEPKEFEVQLSEIGSMSALTYELSDNSRLVLSGQIDRIDTCEKNDRVLVKIVDYKSGNKALDFMSMYYGLQIQLVFYMNAAIEGMKERKPEKQIIPAAFFYYHLDDPIIETKMDTSNEEIRDRMIRELRPTGSIRNDAEVVAAIDEKAAEAIFKKEAYKSDVARIDIKKDGGYSAYSETINGEDMDVMRDHVLMTVKRIGEEMISGRIAVDPYRFKDQSACTYCSYRSVCGFDEGLPGYEYHRLEKLGKKEDIIEKMREETKA